MDEDARSALRHGHDDRRGCQNSPRIEILTQTAAGIGFAAARVAIAAMLRFYFI
jgi:hypothetical protein